MAAAPTPQLDTQGVAQAIVTDFQTSPGAQGRDLTEQQISKLRAELDHNLFLFAVMVCGFHDLTPGYHGPICRVPQCLGPHRPPRAVAQIFGHKRLMLQISRDTFKTTVGTITNSLQKVAC